jgi:hypothetical protein
MIPTSAMFDQSILALLLAHDPVVQRYRRLFALFEWSVVPPRAADRAWPGPEPHPQTAYIKVLLVKLCEGYSYITQLRRFLVEHPLLVLDLGFLPVLDESQPYGFDVQRTVPGDRWLRYQQQTLDPALLHDLLVATVHALLTEIPGLGEIIAIDVKHIYAWVKENNPRESMKDRFCKDQQPTGDPDCRVGVKRSTNQEQPDGSTKEKKEYLWGYGTGVVAATTPDYGDVVLAEWTQPFNENDVTYALPLYSQTVTTLGFFPTHITADAAFDAWYLYQRSALHGGIAAIPLNQHAHPVFVRDADGTPRCPKGLRMVPTSAFAHTNGYRAQRYRCPLLYPSPSAQTCDHTQFTKEKGCVKDINVELGGLMRVTLDRSAPLYRLLYNQRTSCERINSQSQALGIERPKVRNGRSVRTLNTLTYLIINAKALAKAKSINAQLLQIR